MKTDYSKDYYKLLIVPQNATKEEIEIAYRGQIKVFHPDNVSCGGNLKKEYANRFIEIQEAYEILSNEQLRKIYDEQRQNYCDNNNGMECSNSTQNDFSINFWEKQGKACGDLYKDDINKIKVKQTQFINNYDNSSNGCGCLIATGIIVLFFCIGFFFL